MVKIVLKCIVKLLILTIVILMMALGMSKVLRPDREDVQNNTKAKVLGFYELKKNSLDILFIGSSHMYYGVNPAIINEKTDLNSYLFAGECQPVEVSYYFLKEALNYQKPQLVVLDVFGLSNSINACKTEGIYRVNLENLKTDFVKVEAYRDLFKEEDILYNIFDVSLYHNRWYELTLKKLHTKYDLNDFGYTLGKNFSHAVVSFDNMYDGEKLAVDLTYLKKIEELCKQNDIKLLLIKTPYYLSKQDAEIFTYLKEETNFDFIDFNNLDFNYVFDLDGDVWHSNAFGAEKISNYLSKYINSNYQLAKTSDLYDELYYKMLVDFKKATYKEEWTLDKVIDNLKKDHQILLMNYNYFAGSLITEKDKEILSGLGYNFSDYPHKKAIYKVGENGLEAYYNDDYFVKEFVLGDNVFKVESNGYMWKNNEGLNIANNYACITVIDAINYEVIDSLCMDTEGGLYIHRD